MWKWALIGVVVGGLMKPMGTQGFMDPSMPAYWISKVILMVFMALVFMAGYGIYRWLKQPSPYDQEQK